MPVKKTNFILLMFYFALSGCVSVPEQFNAQEFLAPDSATLLIYRPHNLANVLVEPQLMMDGEMKYAIKNNECNVLRLAPGTHHVSLLLEGRYQGQHDVVLETELNQIYFLSLESSVQFKQNQPYDRRFDLNRVNEASAQSGFASCNSSIQSIAVKSETQTEIQNETIPESRTGDEAQYSHDKFKNPFGH